MSKKRILLLMPIPFWHPGTLELIQGLKNNDLEVVALDIWELRYYDQLGEIHSTLPKFIQGFVARVLKRILRKRVMRKYLKENDIVDIQWCGYYYSKYMPFIKKQKVKIVATLFGSDLYRSSLEEKKKMTPIFETSDLIVMGPNMLDDFSSFFAGYDSKIRFGQYGSGKLDLVHNLNTPENKTLLRQKYGIPEQKVVITVGYNAKPEQQHTILLNQIMSYPQELKDKLFFLFPLTYGSGDNSEYFISLITLIAEFGCEYLSMTERISDIEMAETKIISDVTINLQTTDALSSSIKEAMVGLDILLVGEWLPYNIYAEMGVFFIQSNINDFGSKLLHIIENMDAYRAKCVNNPQKIMDFASWQAVLPQFLKTYNELWQE